MSDIDNKNWYVLKVTSGREEALAALIEDTVEGTKVLVPKEDVQRVALSKVKVVKKNVYPGYILVNMEYSEFTCSRIADIDGTHGLLGGKKVPTAMSREEAERIFTNMEEKASALSARLSFAEGDNIKIISGPFANLNGRVMEVYEEGKKVKVSISVFGQETIFTMDYLEIEKVQGY